MLNPKKNLCRICLGTNNLTDIFAQNASTQIAEQIMYCASVQISPEDSLPSKICTECTLYLRIAYIFRTVCEWTDTQLHRENEVKIVEHVEAKDLVDSASDDIHVVQQMKTDFCYRKLDISALNLISLPTSLQCSEKEILQYSERNTKTEDTILENLNMRHTDLINEELFLHKQSNIQELFNLCINYVTSSSVNEHKICRNRSHTEKLSIKEYKPIVKLSKVLSEVSQLSSENSKLINHQKQLSKENICSKLDNLYNQNNKLFEDESGLINNKTDPVNLIYEEEKYFCKLNEDTEITHKNLKSNNFKYNKLSPNFNKTHFTNGHTGTIEEKRNFVGDEISSEYENDFYSNGSDSVNEVNNLFSQEYELPIDYEKNYIANEVNCSNDEENNPVGDNHLPCHCNYSVGESPSINEAADLTVHISGIDIEVNGHTESQITKEGKILNSKSQLLFHGSYGQMEVNQTDEENCLIKKQINIVKTEDTNEVTTRNSRLMCERYALLRNCVVTNENNDQLNQKTNSHFDIGKGRKMLVEGSLLTNELKHLATNKEIDFKNQRHHDNFCNDPLVCFNNEDPHFHNEEEESEVRNLSIITEIANKINVDLEKYLNTAHLKNNCISGSTEIPQINENEQDSKHSPLTNISLHDFETFEREQLHNANNQYIHNISSCQNNSQLQISSNQNKSKAKISLTKLGSRVGRHIAKKNAGQPPKRYSPLPPGSFKMDQNVKQKIIYDDPSITEKHIEMDEIEESLEKTVELRDVESMLDQEYILEDDLSMPEPIFEETVVTDNFCFIDDQMGLSKINYDGTSMNPVDNQIQIKKNINSQPETKTARRKNSFKKGSPKMKQHQKKANIFINRRMTNWTLPKSSIRSKSSNDTKCSVQVNRNKMNYDNISYNNRNCDDQRTNFLSNSNNETGKKNSNNYKSNRFNSNDDPDYCTIDDSSCEDNYKKAQNVPAKRKLNGKKSRHKQNNMNTTCKICNKSFPFPSHLQRHLTAHIGVKRFTCKYCSKLFLHSYNLSVHMRSHTGDFPLQCNICNRGFASPSVLERHKRSHTGETPFQCRYCLRLFSHASSLNMHEKMHLDRPSYTCDACFKVFSYKSSLTAHKKGHSGLKPHSCNVCHKRFTRRTSVMRHMSCHVEAKKFKCRTCGNVFNSQGSLVKHRKVHSTI